MSASAPKPGRGTGTPSLVLFGSRTATAARQLISSLGGRVAAFQIDEVLPPDVGGPQTALRSDLDYLDKADFEHMAAFCRSFLRRDWCTVDGRDLSEWSGVSTADAVGGWELLSTLIPLLQTALCARRAFEELQPEVLHLGEGVGSVTVAWEAEARRSGVPVRRLPLDPPVSVENEWAPAARPTLGLRRRLSRWKARALRLEESLTLIPLRVERWVRSRPLALVLFARGAPVDLQRVGLWPALDRSPRIRPVYMDRCRVRRIARQAAQRTLEEAEAEFAARWPALETVLDERLRFGDIDLGHALKGWLRHLFLKRLPAFAAEVDAARAVLTRLRPAIVVAKVAWGEPRQAWAHAARRLGFPVVAAQREYYNPGNNEYLPDVPADWVLAIGPSSVEWMAGHGVPSDRVVLVGDLSRADVSSGLLSLDRGETRSRLGLDDRPTVLFADANYHGTSPVESPFFYRRALGLVKGAAARLLDVQFVVKFHGGWNLEGADLFQRRVNFLRPDLLPNLVLAPLGSPIEPWLAAADVVVTDTSAVGYEAMALGLPVVYLRTPEQGNPLPDYRRPREAAFGLPAHGDLASLLRKVLCDPEGVRERLAVGARLLFRYMFAEPRDPLPIIEGLAHGGRPLAAPDAEEPVAVGILGATGR